MATKRTNTPDLRSYLLFAILTLLTPACGKTDQTRTAGESAEGHETGIPESYWSEDDLPGALEVAAARKDAGDGEEVVLVGLVKDFVDGRAVFTLMDLSLPPCDPANCSTPWDYCCIEAKVQTQHAVTVELPDADGRPLRSSVQGYHGLDHLDTVAVKGTVARDENGNVTLTMTALHRR
jgi:hypothetical protein